MTSNPEWSDVTFTSMIRIDSDDRLQNFRIVVEFLRKFFPHAKLLFCEEDDTPKVSAFNIVKSDEHFFIQNQEGKYHHRTRNMNLLADRANTPVVVSYDVDAIIPPTQLAAAIKRVRDGRCDVCNPFSSLRHMDQAQRKRFSVDLDTDKIVEYRPYTAGWKPLVTDFDDVVDLSPFVDQLASEATGLVIVHNRLKYIEFGGANENLLGHASEEMERYVRFTKLGAIWDRIDGPGYHMTHSRVQNDMIRNSHYESNMREIYKVLSSDRGQLKLIVDKWQ